MKEIKIKKAKNFEEVLVEFEKEFPPEAYGIDMSRGVWMTSLHAQEIVNRLNKVVGVDGWEPETTFEKDANGVLCYLKLKVTIDNKTITKPAVGYAQRKAFNKERGKGDVYKSAQTSAMSKAASYYGIGNTMYRGGIAVSSIPGFKEELQRYKNKNNRDPIIIKHVDIIDEDDQGTDVQPEQEEIKTAIEVNSNEKPKEEIKTAIKVEQKPETKPDPKAIEKPPVTNNIKPKRSTDTDTRVFNMTLAITKLGINVNKLAAKLGLPNTNEITDSNWENFRNKIQPDFMVYLGKKKKIEDEIKDEIKTDKLPPQKTSKTELAVVPEEKPKTKTTTKRTRKPKEEPKKESVLASETITRADMDKKEAQKEPELIDADSVENMINTEEQDLLI